MRIAAAARGAALALALVATACGRAPIDYSGPTADWREFAGDKGTYRVYVGGAPARMDITGTSGPNAGRTIPAIYSFDGELLTIAYQLAPGAERPAELTSPPGSQVLLVRYKRAP